MKIVKFDGLPQGVTIKIGCTLIIGTQKPAPSERESA